VIVRTKSGEEKTGARWGNEKAIIAEGKKRKNNKELSDRSMAETTQFQTCASHWSRTPHCLLISFPISLPYRTDEFI
jgi:hypothetical protein